tara:strand:- start:142 stop:465 length:324 start_codon:yes stop_codon:yes gene_type:complete
MLTNKKIKFFTLGLLFLFILNSCGGISGSKKENNDEFLVQKKSPLLMPPDYNELPNPKLKSDPETFKENSDIKELIVKSDENNNSSSDKDKPSKNFEKLFLEKIKKN